MSMHTSREAAKAINFVTEELDDAIAEQLEKYITNDDDARALIFGVLVYSLGSVIKTLATGPHPHFRALNQSQRAQVVGMLASMALSDGPPDDFTVHEVLDEIGQGFVVKGDGNA